MIITTPELLVEHHQIDAFDSGDDSLNHWLKTRAPKKNQITGATRTYVACDKLRVVAYYALTSGAVTVSESLGRVRHNMSDPISVVYPPRVLP